MRQWLSRHGEAGQVNVLLQWHCRSRVYGRVEGGYCTKQAGAGVKPRVDAGGLEVAMKRRCNSLVQRRHQPENSASGKLTKKFQISQWRLELAILDFDGIV